MAYWGYHLIVNASACEKSAITNSMTVASFARRLVKAIDMVAYGDPQIVNFGEGDKEGYTLVQLIETSNICAHFCNVSGDVYLDIFSCKQFDPNVAIEVFRQFFTPTKVQSMMMTRQA